MSIEPLCPELIGLIVTHLKHCLGPVGLSPYSTISSAFQDAIEAHTFSDLTLTSDDFQFLGDALERRPQRQSFLGRLKLSIVLPTYTDQACGWYERNPDHEKNNESFTQSIGRLFKILKRRDEWKSGKSIDLVLSRIYSPMDPELRGWERRQEDQFACELGRRHDLFEHRYEHSYINLMPDEMLPAIKRVKSLTIVDGDTRKVAPAVGAQLAACFPNLETVTLELDDEEKKSPELRQQMRVELGQALQAWEPNATKKLDLSLRHSPPWNEDFENADTRNEQAMDTVSASLGRFISTSNLVHVKLSGPSCIGPEIFNMSNDTAILWPSLQKFTIDVSPVRPDGGWYLWPDALWPPPNSDSGSEHEDAEEDTHIPEHWRSPSPIGSIASSSSYDSNESFFEEVESQRPPDTFNDKRHGIQTGQIPITIFRTHPSPEAEELFEAAVRAIPAMPKLKSLQIDLFIRRCARTGKQDRSFGFTFVKRGTAHALDEGEEHQWRDRVWWEAPENWRARGSLDAAWKQVLGSDGKMRLMAW